MSALRLVFLVLCTFSVNAVANHAHPESHSRMCLTAYLANRIHIGDLTFYVKDQPIGNISIYGAWLDTIEIIDTGSYFKDQRDFEEQKSFLRVMNLGRELKVNKFTYQSC